MPNTEKRLSLKDFILANGDKNAPVKKVEANRLFGEFLKAGGKTTPRSFENTFYKMSKKQDGVTPKPKSKPNKTKEKPKAKETELDHEAPIAIEPLSQKIEEWLHNFFDQGAVFVARVKELEKNIGAAKKLKELEDFFHDKIR